MKSDLEKIGKTLEYNNKEYTLGIKDLYSKLDSILTTNNIMTCNETIEACRALNTLSHEDRINYISTKWGPQYLEKCMPILLLINNFK